MELRSLVAGRALWRVVEKIERRSGLWFNRPLRIAGSWRAAAVVDVNERIVETAFVHAHVAGRRILDVGSSESLLAFELASLGYAVTALDVRPYPLRHPALGGVRGDIRHAPFRDGVFDTVLAVSTIEHVGLGFYGEPVDADGDRRALVEMARITARGGRLVLTVPFGRAVTMPGHRVYDRARLERLVTGWSMETLACCRRIAPTCWRACEVEEAEDADSSAASAAVALAVLAR